MPTSPDNLPDRAAEIDEALAPMKGAGRSRAIIVLSLVVLAVMIIQLTPLRAWLVDVDAWRETIVAHGAWSRVLFVVSGAALMLIGVPRLLIAFTGGGLFGLLEGLVLGQAASLIGAFAIFQVARWAGRDWARSGFAARPGVVRLLHRSPTISTIFLLRQVPVPGIIINSTLGVTPVRTREFLLGTLLGYLPSGTVATLCGSGLVSASLAEALPRLVAAAGILLVLGWLGRRLLSSRAAESPAA